MGSVRLDGLSLPVGANPEKDQRVGQDELGRHVLQAPDGTQYVIETQAPTQGGSVIKGAARAMYDDPVGATKNAIKGMIGGAWDAMSAPGNALAGKPVTYGDAVGTAGLMMGAGAGMAAPEGALRSGAMRTAGQGTADKILAMLKGGEGAKVTDEMMAAADPQHLYQNYDLPMDAASRGARAKEMGFDTETPLYHGTSAASADQIAASHFNSNAFVSPKESVALDYADNAAGWGEPATLEIRANPLKGGVDYDMPGARFSPFGIGDTPTFNTAVRDGQSMGFDPTGVRLPHARFDPRLAHLKNLSAGVAGMGLMGAQPYFDPYRGQQ